jgi:hypothetical protein
MEMMKERIEDTYMVQVEHVIGQPMKKSHYNTAQQPQYNPRHRFVAQPQYNAQQFQGK